MTRIAGRVINAGVGKETTPGTIVAPSYWLPNTEITFDDKVQKAENIESLGVIDKLNNAHIVKQWAAGSIKGIVHRSSFGMILAGLVGQTSSDTTVETTAKKHTFTVAQNNQHLSLTLAKKDPNLDLRFALARVDSLKVDYVTDNYVMYEAGFIHHVVVGDIVDF